MDVLDYFGSKCRDAIPWVMWIEKQGSTEVTTDMCYAALQAGTVKSEVDPNIISYHIWGFLSPGMRGTAKQTFRQWDRVLDMSGFNVWRSLVLFIKPTAECKKFQLVRKVQHPTAVTNNNQVLKCLDG